MKIGVFGSASKNITNETIEKARQLGMELAKRGHTVITGGCTGLPYEAVLGAKEKRGKTVAYSPAINRKEHAEKYNFPAEGFDEFVFVPKNFGFASHPHICKKYRNVISTAACDAGIIICGAMGTLNEFTNLYDYGKDIGVLTGTGGAADMIKGIIAVLNKPTKSRIVYDSDPARLVGKLERLGQ